MPVGMNIYSERRPLRGRFFMCEPCPFMCSGLQAAFRSRFNDGCNRAGLLPDFKDACSLTYTRPAKTRPGMMTNQVFRRPLKGQLLEAAGMKYRYGFCYTANCINPRISGGDATTGMQA